ncbi:MAG: pseudouridine synthase, partial [Proteobacteria bacterium]|nr:pseudouridine synthase [Pseudomonadota bacterium]
MDDSRRSKGPYKGPRASKFGDKSRGKFGDKKPYGDRKFGDKKFGDRKP